MPKPYSYDLRQKVILAIKLDDVTITEASQRFNISRTVLTSIDLMISEILSSRPSVFSFSHIKDGIVELRDFQTTGVVAFAFGLPFTAVKPGRYSMPDRETQVKAEYLKNCIESMDKLISKLSL